MPAWHSEQASNSISDPTIHPQNRIIKLSQAQQCYSRAVVRFRIVRDAHRILSTHDMSNPIGSPDITAKADVVIIFATYDTLVSMCCRNGQAKDLVSKLVLLACCLEAFINGILALILLEAKEEFTPPWLPQSVRQWPHGPQHRHQPATKTSRKPRAAHASSRKRQPFTKAHLWTRNRKGALNEMLQQRTQPALHHHRSISQPWTGTVLTTRSTRTIGAQLGSGSRHSR